MPYYRSLSSESPDGKRTLENLLKLRALFEEPVDSGAEGHWVERLPQRNLERSLLVATWNLREFDSAKYGSRTDESIQYIAEIISRFDLVAIQEVRRSLDGLDRLMRVLGPTWTYLVSDVTEGRGGNNERLAFVFDKRKVRLSGLAGEVVLPKRSGEEVKQIDRTPYLVGFQSGWAKFVLVTAHLRWGSDNADDKLRLQEIEHLAEFLDKRARDKSSWTRNMILLGDFNIFSTTDDTFKALTNNNFVVPEPIIEARTNLSRTRSYDQIAFHVDHDRIDAEGRGGVLDYQHILYQDEDEETYRDAMGDAYLKKRDGTKRTEKQRSTYYKSWRTYQMSDHLPLWTELRIDYSERYLERKHVGDA